MKINLGAKLKRPALSLVKKAGSMADAAGIKAYLVGGLVRDIILGGKDGDIDITVEGDATGFSRDFADSLGAAWKGFEKFRTGKVFLRDGRGIDFTSARSETYGRTASLPEIKFTTLERDLYRRDFTINAAAVSINRKTMGELSDPFHGIRDIKKKALRALHDRSFMDDPTRILRGLRFEGRFGFKMDRRTFGLMKKAVKAKAFDCVPGERLRDELLLFFREPDPIKALNNLERLGITGAIHPEINIEKNGGNILRKLEKYGALHGATETELLKILSIAPTPAALARLKAPARWIKAAKDIKSARGSIKLLSSGNVKKSAVYSKLDGMEPEAVYFTAFTGGKKILEKNLIFFMENTRDMKADITGADLRSLGIKPGPLYSILLKEALLRKIDGIAPGKKSQLELVKAVINSNK
jgi:tRNA nucleotidyltransferase (CCA-adding enzyme)